MPNPDDTTALPSHHTLDEGAALASLKVVPLRPSAVDDRAHLAGMVRELTEAIEAGQVRGLALVWVGPDHRSTSVYQAASPYGPALVGHVCSLAMELGAGLKDAPGPEWGPG